MPNSPRRPFVPKRTPPEKGASASESEFRVAPPFVHGWAKGYTRGAPATEQPKPVASIADFLAMDTTAAGADYPAPIADFLAMEVPPVPDNAAAEEAPAWAEPQSIADFAAAEASFDYTAAADVSESYEFPPIEHFTDTIAEEGASVAGDRGFAPDSFAELPLPSTSDEYGWEQTDWQRYDWRSAAALGEAGDPAANTAWAQTDWENPASARDVRESAAQAIADALDGIARRIREGDLVIPQPPAAVPDPATIAATLAALLGVRR